MFLNLLTSADFHYLLRGKDFPVLMEDFLHVKKFVLSDIEAHSPNFIVLCQYLSTRSVQDIQTLHI